MLIHKDESTLKERKIKVLLSKYEQLNPEFPHFNLNFEGVQKLGEVDCYAIKMTNTINNDTTLFYYDASNFYLEKQIEIKPNKEVHTIFSDYRDVSGVKHPFRQEIETLLIEQKETEQTNTYKVNIKIDSALFEPPRKVTEDFHFLSGKSVENIPFKFIENHIFLPVNIGGKENL
jgi:hypothetical protein